MIGDILDLSKIESGTLKFVWSDVNINAMIYDLEKVFQLRNKNNPEVEIRFVPGMEECVIRTERLMGTTPEKRPVIESTQMVGDIKEVRLNYITALTLVMSANDIVGNADSSNSNTIKMDIRDIPNTDLIYDSKTDTIKFMDQTFKRVSDTNNLQTLADAYKKDLQVASNKYLEEIGNAANPKTKFITTYNFDDSIIKDNKK